MYTCFLGTGTEKLPIETSPSSADDPTTTTTGPQSPEEAFAQAQQLLNAVSSKPQVLRVATRPGKPGKMRVHLENLEISWNFEKFNKYHGKMT